MSRPRVEPFDGADGRDGFLVRTPYDAGFVDELKETIPYRDREWWPDSKAWWVAAEHDGELGWLLLRRWDCYELIDVDTGEIQLYTAEGRVHA